MSTIPAAPMNRGELRLPGLMNLHFIPIAAGRMPEAQFLAAYVELNLGDWNRQAEPVRVGAMIGIGE